MFYLYIPCSTWGAVVVPTSSGSNVSNLGGQPLVQPNGNVIVPSCDASCVNIISFRSTNGGATWGSLTTVATANFHPFEGNVRASPLPSAEIDGAGNVFVAWADCRWRSNCASNDISFSKSADGLTWSSPVRIPTTPAGSNTPTMDFFNPGIAVNVHTSGSSAKLAVTYYYIDNNSCGSSSTYCKLWVGFVSSTDAGATWSSPVVLAGPMQAGWFPQTSQGYMVGDYISTAFAGASRAFPAYVVGKAPNTTTNAYDVRLSTIQGGIAV